MSRKVGIITMHRVINAGSALQAYALYHAVCKLGYKCEIIDYQYPNEYHKQENQNNRTTPFFTRLWQRIKYFILYRSRAQQKRFNDFHTQAWKSSNYYPNRESLINNPPKYDICITGSDQVWNPRCMKGDSIFFCDFSPNTPHIAYASSFTQGDIPYGLQSHYAQHLSSYKAIGVRENSGVKLIEKLVAKKAEIVCDPTLLLTASDYAPFIAKAHTYTRKRYLLAYILDYAFDPYPTIHEVIKHVSREQGLEVIYLMANSINNYRFGKSITSAGPNEFLKLFSEASFIVTSSFHGVAFSLLFEKDFYAVIPSEESEDSRIQTLLSAVGAIERAIPQGSSIDLLQTANIDYSLINHKLGEYREKSLNYLRNAIAQLP